METFATYHSEVIRAARSEVERMRSAVAGADEDARVNMEARQFARLAELIAAVCDIADTMPEREQPMKANNPTPGGRSLAEIESDMVAAEGAYAEAQERLNRAQRDRDGALAAINRHQSEIDTAVARLRERSPVGSNWKGEGGDGSSVLMLDHEDSSIEEAALLSPMEEDSGFPNQSLATGADDLDGLKAAWEKHNRAKAD